MKPSDRSFLAAEQEGDWRGTSRFLRRAFLPPKQGPTFIGRPPSRASARFLASPNGPQDGRGGALDGRANDRPLPATRMTAWRARPGCFRNSSRGPPDIAKRLSCRRTGGATFLSLAPGPASFLARRDRRGAFLSAHLGTGGPAHTSMARRDPCSGVGTADSSPVVGAGGWSRGSRSTARAVGNRPGDGQRSPSVRIASGHPAVILGARRREDPPALDLALPHQKLHTGPAAFPAAESGPGRCGNCAVPDRCRSSTTQTWCAWDNRPPQTIDLAPNP